MNLIGDPWIPVVFQEGQTRTVGLNDLYEQAEKIRDLALAPPQRIAVMRLLICITQAALDGPEDKDEWLSCKPRIISESLTYLAERKEKFDLFGETPFMQIKDLEAKSDGKLDKLDFGLNDNTLYDKAASETGRKHRGGWTSLNLITFLNFSPSGTMGTAKWHNLNLTQAGAGNAPCLNAVHTFVRDKNLLQTLHLNLLTKVEIKKQPNGEWGQPVWDFFPINPNDKDAMLNASQTYLGRLAPLSRLVKLSPAKRNSFVEKKCVLCKSTPELKFEGPPSYRELSTTLVTTKKNEIRYLRLSADKHIWRDLGSVLVLKADGGPPVLENLRIIGEEVIGLDDEIDFWVGGFIIPYQKPPLDSIEWNLRLPVSLLGEGQLKSYQTNVGLAESSAISLSNAVRTYLDEVNAHKGNDPRSKDTRNGIVKRATSIYWQELDQRYGLLFEDRQVDDDWRRIIRTALRKAYEQSCVHETPRQIQAFVAGQKRLGLHKLMAKGEKNA